MSNEKKNSSIIKARYVILRDSNGNVLPNVEPYSSSVRRKLQETTQIPIYQPETKAEQSIKQEEIKTETKKAPVLVEDKDEIDIDELTIRNIQKEISELFNNL